MPVSVACLSRLFVLVLSSVLLAFGSVRAAAPVSLYSAEVPVNSQADSERAEALKSCLAQVVIKLTGDSGVLSKPQVAKAVAEAERYVQQFQYQQDVVNDNGQPLGRLKLVAQFDHDGVDQLLRDLGLAQTGGTPTTQAAPDVHPSSFRIWVSGVRSAQDYARLIGALAGNEVVREVQPEQARGDGVQLRLLVNGGLQRLLDVLGAGPILRVTNAKPPVDGVDALLSLQP